MLTKGWAFTCLIFIISLNMTDSQSLLAGVKTVLDKRIELNSSYQTVSAVINKLGWKNLSDYAGKQWPKYQTFFPHQESKRKVNITAVFSDQQVYKIINQDEGPIPPSQIANFTLFVPTKFQNYVQVNMTKEQVMSAMGMNLLCYHFTELKNSRGASFEPSWSNYVGTINKTTGEFYSQIIFLGYEDTDDAQDYYIYTVGANRLFGYGYLNYSTNQFQIKQYYGKRIARYYKPDPIV